jgi:hypothetical protein
MSFIPQSRSEWIGQMKLAVFVLALFGYLFFLAEGWSTGLGVYHNPRFCWVAGAFALLAFVVASRVQRWVALAALVVAVIVGLYGYHENAVWWEKLKRLQAQKSACILVTHELIS